MALGAFLAGLLLAETEYRHQVEADIRPFRGLFLGLFFMSVGMMVGIRVVIAEWLPVLGIVAGLLIGKSVVIGLLSRAFGLSAIVSGRVGLILSQGGEFGFVIFGAAMAAGILSPGMGAILFAAVTITMALTPLMAYLGDRYAEWLTPGAVPPASDISKAGGGLEDHIIIIGFGRSVRPSPWCSTPPTPPTSPSTGITGWSPSAGIKEPRSITAPPPKSRSSPRRVRPGAGSGHHDQRAGGCQPGGAGTQVRISGPGDLRPRPGSDPRPPARGSGRNRRGSGNPRGQPSARRHHHPRIGISAEDSAATLDSFREDDYAMLHEIIASRSGPGQDG